MNKLKVSLLLSLLLFTVAALFAATPEPEMIVNGNFSDGSNSWKIQNFEGGLGEMSVVDNALVTKIVETGSIPWHVQIIQDNLFFTLEKGVTYQVSFDVKAAADRTIVSNVGMSGGTWDTYNGNLKFDVGTEYKTITYTFEMEGETDANSRIEFNLGVDSAEVSIKNVSLTPVM